MTKLFLTEAIEWMDLEAVMQIRQTFHYSSSKVIDNGTGS